MFYPMLWNDTDTRDVADVFDEMDREMNSLWNGWNDGWTGMFNGTPVMKTDVVDNGDHYSVEAELPGFKKEDITLDLKDGNLIIAASHEVNDDKKDEKGNYIRRERSTGAVRRSFYVGKDVKPSDISASFENGVLAINVPKKDEKKIENNASRIAIEG